MHRLLGYTVAWVGVTALAVVVSWLAVRGAVQYAVVGDAPVPRVETQPMSVTSAEPDDRRGGDDGVGQGGRDRGAEGEPRQPDEQDNPTGDGTRAAPEAGDEFAGDSDGERNEVDDHREVIETRHGQVIVEFDDQRTSGVRLLSATPDPHYRQHVWETPMWIRVDFTRGQHGSAVFITWHGEQPQVDIYEY